MVVMQKAGQSLGEHNSLAGAPGKYFLLWKDMVTRTLTLTAVFINENVSEIFNLAYIYIVVCLLNARPSADWNVQ